MLHCAGTDVQEIFETLPTIEAGEELNEYEAAVKMLDEYFLPKANIPYERHVFRQMKQESSESVDQFVIRLTHQAENCNFGSQQTKQIRDQVIDRCRSSGLRRKLLERKGPRFEIERCSTNCPCNGSGGNSLGGWKSQKIV